MNPALQNYLQNTQNLQANNGGQQPAQNSPYNPFDAGIQKAIASARQSLGMTREQEEGAFNNALLSFGDAIAQTPPEKGFFNNLVSAGRAISPALRAYDESENTALTQNQDLANQILKQHQLEQERQAKLEQTMWDRQHSINQLAETKRAHDLMYGNQGVYRAQGLGGVNPGEAGQFIPITNKTTQNNYINDKKKYGTALKQVDDILKDNSKIEKDYQEDTFSPTGPFSKYSAPVQNLWGIIANNEDLRKKTAKREALNSEFVELKAGLERALKGGVLGPRILEYFDAEKLYPTISDTPEVRKEKLDKIHEKVRDAYDSADYSLKYGVQIDPSNLDQFKNYLNPQQAVMSQNDEMTSSPGAALTPQSNWPIIVNPETGEEAPLRPDALEEALRRGFKIKEQND